jgi:glycosyltransferase involved in cell wall biosynthesis
MRVTILAPSTRHPVGGVTALYEFANALRRRAHDVFIAHVDFIGWQGSRMPLDAPIGGVDDVTWFDFEDGITHRVGVHDETELPDADFVNYWSTALPAAAGLPFVFLQGHRVLPPDMERRGFTAPCLKICIAMWLLRVAQDLGASPASLTHVPYGIDHGKYRVMRAPETRPAQVAMCFGSHYTKGGHAGLAALELVRSEFPALRAEVFGTVRPGRTLPAWIEFRHRPSQRTIVEDVYNRSRIFVNPSLVEGFGLPSVEAMACGCALVTAANGGSEDFAMDGETAAVCASNSPDELAEPIRRLIRDDAERLRLATAGRAYVQRFDWDESGRRLEELLIDYSADPSRYE